MHQGQNTHNRSSGLANSSNVGLVLGAALAGAVAVTLIRKRRNSGTRGSSDITLSSQVTINQSPEEIYRFWRNFQNLPRVMSFIERVEPGEGNISHWVAKGPAGPSLEWDAEVVDDQPGRLLAWRSIEGSDLQTWGTVVFRPRDSGRRSDGQSTEVSVKFHFCPSGAITHALASFLSGLENSILDSNLKDLKSQLEAGESAKESAKESVRGSVRESGSESPAE